MGNIFASFFDKISWNLMTPPQLSRNAPIPCVLEPVIPSLYVDGRFDPKSPFLHFSDSLRSHFFALHIPLWSEVRFDYVTRTATNAQPHFVAFLSPDQALFFQRPFDFDPCFISEHTLKNTRRTVQQPVWIQNIDARQIISFSAFVIVWVMRRSYLDSASAKAHINKNIVRNYWNLSVAKRVDQKLPVQVAVPFVLGVHSHCRVPQHCFQPSGCHDQFIVFAVFDLVSEQSQHAELVLFVLRMAWDVHHCFSIQINVIDFNVADGGFQSAAPIDQSRVSVNEIFIVQPYEGFDDCFAEVFVHRKSFASPINRRGNSSDLLCYFSAIFVFPLPNFF
mmetsp:Transcript_14411/g.20421  ORF Transcript_14411/g.20421 Transcript_14411/m.20421 type:complete len:335 (+) Transcript_14411:1532-2536(+)